MLITIVVSLVIVLAILYFASSRSSRLMKDQNGIFLSNANRLKIWHEVKKTGGASWYVENGLSDIPLEAVMEAVTHLYSIRNDVTHNSLLFDGFLPGVKNKLRARLQSDKDISLNSAYFLIPVKNDHLWEECTNQLFGLLSNFDLGGIELRVKTYSNNDVVLYIRDLSKLPDIAINKA